MTTDSFPVIIRFRPECAADATELFKLVPEEKFTLTNPEPDPGVSMAMHTIGGMIWEGEIQSAEELAGLLKAMASVPDGHRMLQTIDVVDHFTGDDLEDVVGRAERVVALLGDTDEDVRVRYLETNGLSPRFQP